MRRVNTGLRFVRSHSLEEKASGTTWQAIRSSNSLNLTNLSNDFVFVCDLKLCNMLLGIQSCTSFHSCQYCNGHKVNEKGENKWKGQVVY